MKTIEQIALGTQFSESQVESLMEVVGATPNPTLALNILLGLHVERTFKHLAIKEHRNVKGHGNEDRLMTFLYYDMWHDRVNYSYETYKTKGIYVQDNTDTSLINADNYKEFAVEYSKDTKWVDVILNEKTTGKDNCSASTWDSWADAYGKLSDGE
jgi:hypothetical protein